MSDGGISSLSRCGAVRLRTFKVLRADEGVWVDSCCIDKISSAERSEAINSTYRWYSKADECYVYLNDFLCKIEDITKDKSSVSPEAFLEHIKQGRKCAVRNTEWFHRGWTLQELIAPPKVLFIDKDWKGTIGSKSSLAPLLSEITGISESALHNPQLVTKCSIAERMSWALKRICSRKEDVAYCLLGVFEVNMPLLCGEGGRTAFRRLQLEILKDSNDESIFAWNFKFNNNLEDLRSERLWGISDDSLLAPHPSMFSGSSAILSLDTYEWAPRAPYAVTNRAPLRCFDAKDAGSAGEVTPLIMYLLCKNPQDYARISISGPLSGDYRRLSMCPEELLDRKKRCFVGEETLVYIKA